MTDKLDKVREYVENMHPVIRPRLLRSPEDQQRDRGFDEAMLQAQKHLLAILDDDNGAG